MNDKSALLGQLKIDRDALPQKSGGAGKWVVLGLAIVAAAGGAWIWLRPAPAVPVKVAIALAPAAGGAAAGSVLDASGYVVARRQATVSSQVTGKVVSLTFEEGKPVNAGEVLARLDDTTAHAQLSLSLSQLDSARAGQAVVQAQLSDAERQLKRAKELHEKQLVSDAAVDTAQANFEGLTAQSERAQREVQVAQRNVELQQRNLDFTVIRAPFGGVITVKNAQIGEMISPLSAGGAGTRTGIGTLVDMDSLEIEVDVNENFINRVQPAQPVEATLNAYPDWKIPCKVIAVIPTADRSKATVKVRIGIELKDARILPDMGARVAFLSAGKPAAAAELPKGVFVPVQAVGKDAGADVVYVLKGETVERRAVSLGTLKRGELVQVTSGLTSGERVAVGDLAQLKDGVRVQLDPAQ
ncbi:MAG TPA: efflux RND transporter periplasmic adaptor subunit [Candidatus Binatia bacterium]|nr:efflux RND transporter periplasmic adaptor subunit [Candidatus Binatia bacterium]